MMTNSTLRKVVCLLALLLAGCSNLATLGSVTTGEADLFARGLDEYRASGELSTLEQLPVRYPQGVWSVRARTIIALEKKIAEQEGIIEKLERTQADCRTVQAALEQDNQALEKTLDRLKQVLIETEQQAK